MEGRDRGVLGERVLGILREKAVGEALWVVLLFAVGDYRFAWKKFGMAERKGLAGLFGFVQWDKLDTLIVYH